MSSTDIFGGFTPRKNQLKAVSALSDNQQIVQMDTGEGKTLVIAMAAAKAALAGRRVYVVTVSDYLAKRDFTLFRKQFSQMGILAALNNAPEAHRVQIIYTSVQQLLFDYTANEFKPEEMAFDLDFAILDEIDYVLLDSANTRFSVSMGDGCAFRDTRALEAVWQFSLSLPRGSYSFNPYKKEIELTDIAYNLLEASFGVSPEDARYRDFVSYCHTALLAQLCYRNGIEYLIEPDGVLSLLNPYNGRASRNSVYDYELDYCLRRKENIRFPGSADVYVNSMSAPMLFRKFKTVVGVSGTAGQARAELGVLLGSGLRIVKPYSRSQRLEKKKHFRTQQHKLEFILSFIRQHGNGYAYLVICEHEPEAEAVYNALALSLNRDITLLTNAETDSEQHIIDNAGRMGHVLVSTHLVGRGTDIVSENLAVLITHKSYDIRGDRQAIGRTGRNGSPGIALLLTSDEDTPHHRCFGSERAVSLLEDTLFENAKAELLEWLRQLCAEADDPVFESLVRQEFVYHWLDFRRSLSGRLLYGISGSGINLIYNACQRLRQEMKELQQDVLHRAAAIIMRAFL